MRLSLENFREKELENKKNYDDDDNNDNDNKDDDDDDYYGHLQLTSFLFYISIRSSVRFTIIINFPKNFPENIVHREHDTSKALQQLFFQLDH
ncbi:hypothetical protein Phum_PHUM597910 [Pediculus humanus corporis]|uniref:RWD domain-containing protein n=1 Tax=Pediculus humanus subsp. corporis TaxID=121224 RepID=E0W2V9_PEDHC|nr:uncharacterized protein Phum_PHUM597910 [Pediculus humanus corporis]EEB19965.1 hypothetical protein Phum_PHUM597910 [Pediculus humanus corporis]